MTFTPSSRLILQTIRLESMRARAIGQSATVITSAPPSRSVRAPFIKPSTFAPSGGSSSTAKGFRALSQSASQNGSCRSAARSRSRFCAG